MKKTLLLIISILSLWSCSNVQSSQQQKSLSGYWKSMGYGQVLEINDSTVKAYDVCEVSCLSKFEIPLETLATIYEIDHFDADSLKIKAGITEYQFVKIESIPDFCNSISKVQNEDPLFNFESMWHTFNEQYAYFEERNIDWHLLKEKYSSKLSPSASPLELYLVLEEMLGEIKDGHVSISLPEILARKYQEVKGKQNISKKKNFDTASQNIMGHYVKDLKSYNKGVLSWGQINDDVVYINIWVMDHMSNYDPTQKLSMSDFWDNYWENDDNSENSLRDNLDGMRFIMDSIVTEIGDSKACIIDVRFNGGGEDAVALEILNHFADEKSIAFTKKAKSDSGYTPKQEIYLNPSEKRYVGDVYILISPRTASAAEIFALGSMALPTAKRVGSSTLGILSDKLVKKLPIGWEYTLSNEVYQSLDNISYESVGIPPNYNVDYGENITQFYRILSNKVSPKDEAIEMVLQIVEGEIDE